MYLHIYGNNPTAGAADGTQISETISTTLSANALAGATTITVTSATNFYAGLAIKINTESATISSISSNTITLSAGLAGAHNSGEIVINSSAGTNPLTIGPLNASTSQESTPVKLAIRCDTGYVTGASTTITPTGTNAADWALAPDNSGSAGTFGAYGVALSLASGINTTNTIFWVKAKAVTTDTPSNDTSVSLHAQCSTIMSA